MDTAVVAAAARELIDKFRSDRGPQLAAMIAYYALLSFVPLVFIAVSIVGFFGHASASSAFVKKLGHIFPDSSLKTIASTINDIRSHSTVLGILGLVFLVWTSLGLFGALESAFNIVYSRPNRAFVEGKLRAMTALSALLVLLFVGLGVGSLGYGELERLIPGLAGNPVAAYALPLVVSAAAVFGFLLFAYYLLPNVPQGLRDVLPGAVVATTVLEATFQALPVYLHLSRNSTAQRAFGGPVILLVWLYVMANVTVFGAEVNWWLARRRTGPQPSLF